MWSRSVCVLAIVAIVGCGSDKDSGPAHHVTLGALLDRTGPQAQPSWEESIDLAIRQMNAALKASGDSRFADMDFTLTVGDTQSNIPVAVDLAKQLGAEGVKALLVQQAPIAVPVNKLNYDGTNLNTAIICGNCVQASFNNPTSTDPDPLTQNTLRDPDNWAFRSIMDNGPDVDLLLAMLAGSNNGDVNNDGVFKISTYATEESAANGFRNKVASTAKARYEVKDQGGNVIRPVIVEHIRFPFAIDVLNYDFTSDAAKLADNQTTDTSGISVTDVYPDALIEQSPSGISANITKEHVDAQYGIRFLHTSNFRNTTTFVVIAGDSVNGQDGTSVQLVADSASGATFNADISKITGVPELQDAQWYDAATSLMLAALIAIQENNLENVEDVTQSQVRDAIRKTSQVGSGAVVLAGASGLSEAVNFIAAGTPINYDGASGPVDYDEYGNVRNVLVHWLVENRRFVEYEHYDCITSSTCPVIAE